MSARRKYNFDGSPAKVQRDKIMRERTYVEADHSMKNSDFILRYAQPGSIVLVGGTDLIENVIRLAQISASDWTKCLWSHISVFEGPRPDGKAWLYCSDFDIKNVFASGYCEFSLEEFDSPRYRNVAVLNLPLDVGQRAAIVSEEMRAKNRETKYPMLTALAAVCLGLFSVITKRRFWRLVNRLRRNPWFYTSRGKAMICSCFVREVYRRIGFELCPEFLNAGVLPEDIFKTPILHDRYLLIREQRRKKKPA